MKSMASWPSTRMLKVSNENITLVVLDRLNILNQSFFFLVWIWSQEEHRNMGAWTFVRPRFENMCGQKVNGNS